MAESLTYIMPCDCDIGTYISNAMLKMERLNIPALSKRYLAANFRRPRPAARQRQLTKAQQMLHNKKRFLLA